MGCNQSTPGPIKPRSEGHSYPPEHLVKYDSKDGPFFRTRPEDTRPLRIAEAGPFSAKEMPPETLLKAFFIAKSINGDSPALKVERPCPPLNSDGTIPPSLPEKEWKTWTYEEYWNESRTLAKSLVHVGVERYEGVIIFGFNAPEWTISQLGITMSGGITAGIYPTDSPETVAYKTRHCRARVAIVEDMSKVSKLETVLDQIPRLTHIVGYSPAFQTSKILQRSNQTTVQVLPWREFLELGKNVEEEHLDTIMESIKPEDCFCFIYTSGTTGNSKAVMLSHDNVVVESRSIVMVSPKLGNGGQERILSYLPLSHVAAEIIDIVAPITLTAFRPGYVTVYYSRPYDLKLGGLVERMKIVRPTIFFAVPRVYEKFQEKLSSKLREVQGLKKLVVKWGLGKSLAYYRNMQVGGSGDYPTGYEKAYQKVIASLY